jgi:general secretion pathway protein F/type IV pilus assembly protein PilC
MATYTYTAIDKSGQTRKSRLEAATRTDAIALLQSDGLVAISISEATTSGLRRKTVSKAAVARIYTMLANQMDVGVPLLKALQVIRESEQQPGVQRLLDDIIAKVTAGNSLSQAFSYHRAQFSTVDINVVRAGEEGGFLNAALNRIVQLREWQSSMASSLWGALAYPLILIAVASIILPSIMIFIVPRFEPLYESLRSSGKMPWITSSLLAISAALEQYGLWVMIGATLGSFVLFKWTRASDRTIWMEQLMERSPIVGRVFQDWSLSQFCRVLGMLLDNRVQLLTALEIAATSSGSMQLVRTIEQARKELGEGSMLAQPLARSGRVSKEILAMISIAEQSNTLATVLNKIAIQLETQLKKRLELGVKLVEPLMLLILAILVGTIVIALLLPIFENNGLG